MGLAIVRARSRGPGTIGNSQTAGLRRSEFIKRPDHSGLMLAAWIILAHFSVSSEMNFVNSAGERASGVPPSAARRAFTVGAARAALISLLSLSMIASGVFRGATMPYHALISKPGTYSAMVGR